MLVEIGLANFQSLIRRWHRRIFHHDIRLDALGLDGAPVRREVARGGELDRGAVADRQDGLHRALAEGAGAHDDGALVILQGARHDFGGRGRSAVHQHHHRHLFHAIRQVFQIIDLHRTQIVFTAGGQPHLGVVGTALGIHHQAVGLDESRRHRHRAIEQTARVVAQIEDQPLQRRLVVLVQLAQGLGQQLAGVLLELRHAHIAVAVFQQLGFDAADLDDRPRQRQHDGLVDALARDGELDRRPRLAAHALDRIVQGHALHRGIVELDDQIAGLDPGLEGRRVLDRRNDLDEAVLHADFDAQAAEFALRAHLQIFETFGVQIRGMRVQPGQHAVDRLGDQLLVFHRLDVIALDAGEHIGKGTQLLDRQRRLRFLVGDRRQVDRQRRARQYAGQADEYEFCLVRHLTSPTGGD